MTARPAALVAALVVGTSCAVAQRTTLSGEVADSITGETLPGAAAALLSARDSSLVAGAAADGEGAFTLVAPKPGKYLLRLSYMGYETRLVAVPAAVGGGEVRLGRLYLAEDATVMREAEVTAKMAQMEVQEDTFVYNADAFRLPEGSALEELVRRLPGAEVDDDGNITINGKAVSRIMVEGKEFFDGDTKMAMKNLPSKMVRKIKSYDRKSDYTRITGIDDGEEETVLDLSVQRGMRDGWLASLDAGGGTRDRYTLKANASRFADDMQFTLLGSRNNVGDNGFPGGGFRGGGGGGGGGGVTTSSMAGLNMVWENGRKEGDAGYLKAGGNARYSSLKSATDTRQSSETFLTGQESTYGNQARHAVTHSASVNVNLQLEWQADSLTNIILRPNFTHSASDNYARSLSATFGQDPYAAGLASPLDEFAGMEDPDSIRVNSNDSYTFGDARSNGGNASLQINRRLRRPGRNISLNAQGEFNRSTSGSYSRAQIRYYRNGSDEATYQDTRSPGETYSYQARLSYSEPLWGGVVLQMSYQLQRRFQDQDRTVMTYEDLAARLDEMGITYTAEDLYLGNVAGLDALQMMKDEANSQYATYKELNHNATMMLRYNGKLDNGQQLQLNAGASFQPQSTHMDYRKNLIDTTITRRTRDWAPRVDARWKISNTSQLRVRYRGSMSQPSMTNLVEATDSSDPLNISTGNSSLRSSWNDNFFAFYNGYNPGRQRGWAVNMNGNITRRSISNATIYDAETGGKYQRPMNINGNWNAGGMAMFNTALGAKKAFNLTTSTNLRYTNSVGYISGDIGDEARDYLTSGPAGGVDMQGLFGHSRLEQAATKTTALGENARINYRGDLGQNGGYGLDAGASGALNYQHARNRTQASANLDTWTYSYGGNLTLNTPFSLSLSTDISMQSRRGYSDQTMNTNELIWNVQLSQSLRPWLRDHDLTVSLQCYDLLARRSNISRAITATTRSDTYTNAINSYLMVHIIYKLNLIGNRDTRGNFPQSPGPGTFGPPAGGSFRSHGNGRI